MLQSAINTVGIYKLHSTLVYYYNIFCRTVHLTIIRCYTNINDVSSLYLRLAKSYQRSSRQCVLIITHNIFKLFTYTRK